MRARWVGPLLAASLAVFAGEASARDVPPDDPPATTSTAPAPSPSAGASTGRPHSRRPWVVGLIAAAFLLMGGIAGANDKPSKSGSAPAPPKS